MNILTFSVPISLFRVTAQVGLYPIAELGGKTDYTLDWSKVNNRLMENRILCGTSSPCRLRKSERHEPLH